jgi:DNA helicase-2/ATP-dependent DNA helicase PcrA
MDAGLPAGLYNAEADPTTQVEHEGVRISSLHSAKGHEYTAVFIVGCVQGALPLDSAVESDEVASERALLYVGMTRARDILYLSYSEMNAVLFKFRCLMDFATILRYKDLA